VLIWILHLDQPATSRSIPAGGYNSAPREMAPPLPARAPPGRYNSAPAPPLPARAARAPPGRHNSAPRGMAPPLPARAPPVRIGNNQQRPYDQAGHQSYPDSTTHRGAGGYGGYRDVAYHYDEDGEGEAVGEFQGEEDQGEGEDEEAEEQAEPEPEPEDEQEEEYHGGEPVEDYEEEQGYNAHNYGGYEAGQTVEEGEDEYDGGYSY
jgi:hypothetical protein